MKLAIVDDNKLEQELIFNTLRTYEHERNISLEISSYSDGNPFLNTYVPGDFDLIFMDAAKGQYIHFMPDILRLLKTGGTLVSDNVLQDGDIIESHYAVIRRNRTIYKRMREYLYELTHRKDLVTAVLPVGDGITVSTKVEVENDEKE